MAESDLVDRPAEAERRRDTLVERLFQAVLGFNDLHMVYVGDQLDLYRALAEHGPATAARIAGVTGTHERYVREWLEHQAVGGILEVDDASLDPGARRYRIPTGHDEVLLDRESLNYLAPFARMMVGMTRPLPAVIERRSVPAAVCPTPTTTPTSARARRR